MNNRRLSSQVCGDGEANSDCICSIGSPGQLYHRVSTVQDLGWTTEGLIDLARPFLASLEYLSRSSIPAFDTSAIQNPSTWLLLVVMAVISR